MERKKRKRKREKEDGEETKYHKWTNSNDAEATHSPFRTFAPPSGVVNNAKRKRGKANVEK